MLVVRRREVGPDQVAVRVVRAGGHGLGGHHAGQRHAHFERAILMEDPVEAVIVIAHGGDEAEHQVAGAARFVVVLPGDAAIAFVERDGARDARRAGPRNPRGRRRRACSSAGNPPRRAAESR